jgi:hypothetical protein
MLDRTLNLVGIGAVLALLVSRLTDTADGRKRSVQDPYDLTDGNLLRSFDELVPSLHPSATGKKAGSLQSEENLLKIFHGNPLTASDIMTLEGGLPICQGEFEKGAKPIFTFLREFQGELIECLNQDSKITLSS